MSRTLLPYALPVVLGVVVLALWEFVVRHYDVPPYVLPAPSAIVIAFLNNFASLTAALAATRGNQIRAADLLGLNRNTLRKKIRDLDIQVFRGGT